MQGEAEREAKALDLSGSPYRAPSWNQIQDWLTQLGRLKVDLESRAPGAP